MNDRHDLCVLLDAQLDAAINECQANLPHPSLQGNVFLTRHAFAAGVAWALRFCRDSITDDTDPDEGVAVLASLLGIAERRAQ